MIYPANFEQKIGFDRLREQVVALCSTQAAREIISAERFSTRRSDIEFRQDIADEMRVIIMLEPDAPHDEFPDLEGVLSKIGVEGMFLTVEELVVLQGTTPRQYTDLIGSLCDLTSGSGDKGTPIVLVQGYFDNYTN